MGRAAIRIRLGKMAAHRRSLTEEQAQKEIAARAARVTELLDHLIGSGVNSGRDVEAKRLGGLEVDDHLELSRKLHRESGWPEARGEYS
jgi:hypothetical protein